MTISRSIAKANGVGIGLLFRPAKLRPLIAKAQVSCPIRRKQ